MTRIVDPPAGSAQWWDRARVLLTEHAARLDDTMTLNLAIHYGRGPEHVLSLLSEVFWRVPIEVRISLLDEALWRTGLHDEVPFLVPNLRAIFHIRNNLAHSITYRMTDEIIDLRTVKRGKAAEIKLAAHELQWATLQADLCGVYFMRIEGRIGDVEIWAQLYGFGQRSDP
jgi:hypothetical protein